ncbi:MAG: hypothetical protein Greene041619_110 [Candidatus Peregrinibacteria bacterium Greene0416_19]|nr:MAG: hypothetical protein Greene041619_110 [Candidatus Peregrinibacteria bacterium Greene0416_19]
MAVKGLRLLGGVAVVVAITLSVGSNRGPANHRAQLVSGDGTLTQPPVNTLPDTAMTVGEEENKRLHSACRTQAAFIDQDPEVTDTRLYQVRIVVEGTATNESESAARLAAIADAARQLQKNLVEMQKHLLSRLADKTKAFAIALQDSADDPDTSVAHTTCSQAWENGRSHATCPLSRQVRIILCIND